MARAKRDAAPSLDSFLDIMTCLVGVLVLIIILTGIDASQIKVVIPTPMAKETDKRPILIECRDGQLFRVDVDGLRKLSREELAKIQQGVTDDIGRTLQSLADATPKDEFYTVDLTYALTGQFAINPNEGVPGYKLTLNEGERDWYGQILLGLNMDTEMITFLVRDNSFRAFRLARHLAWLHKIDVSYELFDSDDVIKFGIGGSRSLPQ